MESQNEDISFIKKLKKHFTQVDLTDETNTIVHCSNTLQDCEQCISKIFEIIAFMPTDTSSANIKTILNYVNEIILILKMLTKFIDNIVQVQSLNLKNAPSVPFVMGKIIFVIFSHCKASTSIYGVNVDKVEEILKHLFFSCRELQTFYLNMLSTHFVYNHSNTEELDLLMNVLNINLQIAELANDLDVKTMAEQWKAYLLLCEEYSSYLKNTSIFNTTLSSVVKLVVNGIKSIVEDSHPENYTLRTLKVTNFLIKILGKLFEIFEEGSSNDYGQVVYMFSYLKIFSSEYLATLCKPPDLFKKIDDNLSQMIDHLLKLHIANNSFMQELINFNLEQLEGDMMLGYVHLLISVMTHFTTAYTNNKGHQNFNNERCQSIISSIFNLLPQCQTWFNLDLQYYCSISGETPLSLFEYLLMNTALLVATCDSDSYTVVEKCMYEAILDVDFWKALFACDLWILLASYAPTKLVYDQLIFLCTTYKKLNTKKLFGTSPQKVHLSYLLQELYKALSVNFQYEFYEKYPIEEDNLVLWQAIKIDDIPCEIVSKVVCGFEFLLEQVEMKLLRYADVNHVYELINLFKIMSTCPQLCIESLQNIDIIQKWDLQILLEDKSFIDKEEEEMAWFIDYVDALCDITERIINENGINVVNMQKILLSITAMMCETRSMAVKVILLKFLHKVIKSENFQLSMFTNETINILHEALQCDNRLLHATLCEILSCLDNSTNTITTKLLSLVKHMQNQEYLRFLIKNKKIETNTKLSRKEQFLLISKIEYSHKCVRSQCDIEITRGNFEIDLDSLLEAEEPACKKTKLDSTYVDNIICKIEDNTRLLSEFHKYNFDEEHRARIVTVCEKLKCLCN